MLKGFQIRTDLALEARESFEEDEVPVGAVIINDLHVDMAREICKDLNTKESRVRYSVGFEPAFSKTGISITCDFEEDGDDETTEYDILS